MVICAVHIISILVIPVNCAIRSQQATKCDNKLISNWLWNLRNNNLCVNIIVDYSISVPQCVYDRIFYSKFVYQVYDLNAITLRNILKFPPTNCNNFIFFMDHFTESYQLFAGNHTKRFVPFSQLFFVVTEPVHLNSVRSEQTILNYIYENGLFVYMVENTLSWSNELRFLSLTNVLDGQTLNLTTSVRGDVIRYFGSYNNHPFLNTSYKEKVFRVSLFKCVPYVIYLSDGSFDGIQYRTIQEIARPWKIEHTKCDFSSKVTVPWNQVLHNVNDGVSDVAMCSIWMNKPLTQYDPSTYFDLQCGTFLVPKPRPLNPAAYLYLSLNANDWYFFLLSLILMTMCFTWFTRIGMLVIDPWVDVVYRKFSRSLMDALDMATNHGLVKFPKEQCLKFLVNRSVSKLGTLLFVNESIH